ncbi:MAG: aminotransferase class III-fold pyridoxal phosphate-dependent enzyme [Candidatus Aminicenantes bacterium]|nr:aminotransferase class III-fold pyridoxal phosphate-dependent enzyme [Candidatus Aminicenantes bacterium]
MNPTERMIQILERRYKKMTPGSLRIFRRAEKAMIRGGSHSLRLLSPYPFFVKNASGPSVIDIDGNEYLDFWQGHYANILGHNPGLTVPGDKNAGLEEESLHTGFEVETQVRLAELLLKLIGWKGHKVRFTTSGTLAAMYAVMLALGKTGRDEIVKIGGGWHGASPLLLKGVKFDPERGFRQIESAGVPESLGRKIHIVRFNDPDGLERLFQKRGDRIACFILEPYLGTGGFLPATREFLSEARRLTARCGAVLIFDEIISGFRFAPTGVQRLAGIEPDLSTFGKVIGGGHAVAAVLGKAEIMDCIQAGPGRRNRVQFTGGTFSAHPQYLRAGLKMLLRLVAQAGEIYPRIAAMGERLRTRVEEVFAAEGYNVYCTGRGNEVVGGSSLLMVNFLRSGRPVRRAEDVQDPRLSNIRLREEILRLALLTRGVHAVHGGGAVSAAHAEQDIDRAVEAFAETARLFKKSGIS